MILAIDTSTELASVALINAGQVIFKESRGVSNHSSQLLPMVQALLSESGSSLSQCDAFAAGCGPGAFTGVRTTCGVVQGLAFALDRPVVAVPSLLAMAQSCCSQNEISEVVSLLDARMNEVYWAQYYFVDGHWKERIVPRLSSLKDVEPDFFFGRPAVCGNGLLIYPDVFNEQFSGLKYPNHIPHARYVAQLGQAFYLEGQCMDAMQLVPMYLRNKVAKTIAQREAETLVGS